MFRFSGVLFTRSTGDGFTCVLVNWSAGVLVYWYFGLLVLVFWPNEVLLYYNVLNECFTLHSDLLTEQEPDKLSVGHPSLLLG